uniref:BED-type domain-containing protein n=1 Tax=Chenopodium quinoa TaxID=63459 RepID=A0A803MEQ0_CHEQI
MEEVSSTPTNGNDDDEGFVDPSSYVKEPTNVTKKQSTKVNDEEIIGVNGRKLTSVVWKHFDQIKVNGEDKAKCKDCKKLFVGGGKSGTTHLRDHIKRCMKIKNTMDVKRQLLQAMSSKSGSPSLGMGKFKFNAQVSRSELVNMNILHEYPLAIVEHVGFRIFVSSLNPDFKVISKNTVKADILRDYKEERSKLMRLFAENDSRIAITTDMWSSSNQRKGYMAVTAHYIDDDWVLRELIIRFLYVPCPHNKESISKALVKCLKSFNIDEKVSTITLDNCTTNDAVVDVLREKLNSSKLIMGGSYLHMRCCAHILNLIVGDGLEMISGAIEKVRSVVAFCVSTPKRYEKFEDACNYCRIPITKKLTLDCKTRWNSCYDMLQIALMYKDAFTRLDSKVSKSGRDKFKLPSKEDWKMASEICERLALFKRATEAFSGRKYPTANLYFEKVCEILLALRKWVCCGNKVIESMASKMIVKFDKYWNVINVMLSVASVLDPRRKLDIVTFYYRLMYGDCFEMECDRVKRLLVDLVHDYEMDASYDNTSFSVTSSFVNVNGKRPMDEFDDIEGLWERHVSQQPSKRTRKCEVETYLLEERLVVDESKFSLLAWWNAESHRFPTLAKIARDILAIPISTVAS